MPRPKKKKVEEYDFELFREEVEENARYGIWTSSKGEEIPIREMSTTQLENAYNKLKRIGGIRAEIYLHLLKKELGRRYIRKENMILYNKGKWLEIWNLPKYKEIREKISSTFNELVFVEEGHKYFLHGKEMTCVSNVTHLFAPKFETDIIAEETFRRNYNNPSSKYYQMTTEQIKKSWSDNSKRACEHGTERHEFGENAFYYMTGQYDKMSETFKERITEDGGFRAIYPKEEAVVKFYNDIPSNYIPILCETKVYSEELGYAGTFDILFYYDDPEGKKSGLVIFDWKTNKDLYKNFNEEKLLPPFSSMLNMPVSIYTLQQSLYQIPLEDIGFKIVGKKLLWLKEDGKYEKITLKSCANILRKELRHAS